MIYIYIYINIQNIYLFFNFLQEITTSFQLCIALVSLILVKRKIFSRTSPSFDGFDWQNFWRIFIIFAALEINFSYSFSFLDATRVTHWSQANVCSDLHLHDPWNRYSAWHSSNKTHMGLLLGREKCLVFSLSIVYNRSK